MVERAPTTVAWFNPDLSTLTRQLEAPWLSAVLDRPGTAAALVLSVLPAEHGDNRGVVWLQLRSADQVHGAVRAQIGVLPFADASFGVVLLQHAHEFCVDADRLLAECLRLLIPGGRLLVCGFNPWSWSRWRRSRRGVLKRPRLHGVARLDRRLRIHGLTSKAVRYLPWPDCRLETRLPLRQLQALYLLEASRQPPDFLPLRRLRLPAGAVPG